MAVAAWRWCCFAVVLVVGKSSLGKAARLRQIISDASAECKWAPLHVDLLRALLPSPQIPLWALLLCASSVSFSPVMHAPSKINTHWHAGFTTDD